MIVTKPICERCCNVEFEVVCTDKIVEEFVSAKEYFSSKSIIKEVLPIMRFHNYKATCKQCGASYSFIR